MLKISGGRFRGRSLAPIPERAIRPPLDKIKQAIFNIAGGIEGVRVLDLFAGSGSLGLEALSRGAAAVTFVEQHPGSLRVLEANINRLGVAPQSTVLRASVLDAPDRLQGSFQLLLVDPPYALYDDPEAAKKLGRALDAMKTRGILTPGFFGAIESPRGKGSRLALQEIGVRDIRAYGHTEVLFVG